MGVPGWLEITLVAVSIAMFVGSLVAIPWIIRRLPPDHFARPPKAHSLRTKLLRNVGGSLLVAAGIAMLLLPGQGIIAILFGLSIMDLAIKDKILRRLLGRKKIQEGVQRIRSRAGKPPLIIPTEPVTA
jgi:hypothetical protein